jgi:hypothetical protein
MRLSTLFWGLVLIVVGGLVLLSNLGLIPAGAWGLVWPVFIIAAGVWILLGTVVRRRPKSEHVVIPLGGAGRAAVRLRHGAGRIDLGSLSSGDALLEGDFDSGVEVRDSITDGRKTVTLQPPDRFLWGGWGPGERIDWQLRLSALPTLDLDIETGASETRLDLSGLKVTGLRVQTGASSTSVVLPAAAGMTHAEFDGGAASVRISIPDGVAGRIRCRGGLNTVQVDSQRFPRQGEYYQSADYDNAANRVDISIEMGVGSVTIS